MDALKEDMMARLEAVLRKSHVTVFEQNRSGNYIWISGPFLGLEPEKIVGRQDSDIFPPDVAEKLKAVKRELLKSGEPVNYEFQLDGNTNRQWFDLHLEPLKGERGGLTGAFIEITERKKLEIELRILLREVTHRSKNLLAVIQAMARQTASGAGKISDFVSRFEKRLAGIARSHDLLVEANWQDVALAELVKLQLMQGEVLDPRIHLQGPDIRLSPAAAQNLGLAFHELGTNALKYGALSVAEGHVDVRWDYIDDDRFPKGEGILVEWVEINGPPVRTPRRQGFGYVVIERIVSRGLSGYVEMAFDRAGFRWKLIFPRSHQEEQN